MPLNWAPDHPIRSRMIFASGTCPLNSPDKLTTALDLYQGGCLTQLRGRLGRSSEHRARIRLLTPATESYTPIPNSCRTGTV